MSESLDANREVRRASGVSRSACSRSRLAAAVPMFILLVAAPTRVRAQSSEVPVRIWGTVFDSLTRKPLAGARVVLHSEREESGDQSDTTNSLGEYSLSAKRGRTYGISFGHPLLDSLGLVSPRVIAKVDGSEPLRVDLTVPSAASLVEMACGIDSPGRSRGLIFGHVRSSSGRTAIEGGGVVGQWTALDTSSALRIESRETVVPTSRSGWFALCDVEPNVAVLLRVGMANDSSGWIRTMVDESSVRHVTLSLGGAERRVSDSGTVYWSGEASIRGIVRDWRGQPVSGARVTLWGSREEATTNTRGGFMLGRLPAGTQMLEVRAVGSTPVEQAVNLRADSVEEISIQLRQFVPELAGVTVRGRTSLGGKLAGFEERRRDVERGINYGHFITGEEIERRRPPLMSSMLEGIPGVSVRRLGRNSDARRSTAILGVNGCPMTVYLDGHRVIPASLGVVRADSVAGVYDGTSFNELIPQWNAVSGIEVYPRPLGAPPQYQTVAGTCGVVLIWTK